MPEVENVGGEQVERYPVEYVFDGICAGDEVSLQLQAAEAIQSQENPYLYMFLKVNGSKFSWKGLTDRRILTQMFAFAVPDESAIRTVAKYSPIIEIGAGSGYWASMLSKAGCDIVCFDDLSHERMSYRFSQNWHKVNCGGPEKLQIDENGKRALLLCWPDLNSAMASQTLEEYIRCGGRTLIYIGEIGGCTANAEFHERLEELTIIEKAEMLNWYGIYSTITVYRCGPQEG